MKSIIKVFRDSASARIRRRRIASPKEVERAEWSLYINYLQDGMTAFDIGAHVGRLVVLFSKFVGDTGSVHAFEPNQDTFRRLAAVCASTGLSNTVLNEIALTDRKGIATLYAFDDEYSSWSSLARRPFPELEGTQHSPISRDVVTLTLDTYCSDRGISRIHLLKVDAEGAELQVLLGSRRMLEEQRIGMCVFEVGEATFDMGNRPQEIETYLQDVGYKVDNVIAGGPKLGGISSRRSAGFSMYVARPA